MAGSRREGSGVEWRGAVLLAFFSFFFSLSLLVYGEAKNSKESFSETVKKYLKKGRFISYPLCPSFLIIKKRINLQYCGFEGFEVLTD